MKKKLLVGAVTSIITLGIVDGVTMDNITNAQGYRYGKQMTTDTIVVNNQENIINYGAQAAKNDSALTLEDMLTYSMQDEYLARMEYRMIMNKYGEQRPFSNIILSEEKHISMLTNLFNNYHLSIPEDLSANYVTLPSSLNQAYKDGVTAELENIAMYDRFLQEDIPQDVKNVFLALRDASKNHLYAFQRHVK